MCTVCGTGNEDALNAIYLGSETPGDFSISRPILFGDAFHRTTDLKIVDLDQDGALDILVANDGQPNMIYYGDRAGEPGDVPQYGADSSTISFGIAATRAIRVSDLDKDGHVDILVGNSGTVSTIVWGSGARVDLSSAIPVSLGTQAFAVSDLDLKDVDGDSWPDIVLAVDGAPNILYKNVLRPGGEGVWSLATPISIGDEDERSQSVALRDVNDDGEVDAIFGNLDCTATTYYNEDGVLGGIVEQTGNARLPFDSLGIQAVADFNGDTILDIVTGVDVVFGDGSGDFSHSARRAYLKIGAAEPMAVLATDIDRDGDVDLVISPYGYNVAPYVQLNGGDGDFADPVTHALQGVATAPHTVWVREVDLNGDEYPDLLLGNGVGSATQGWVNGGPEGAGVAFDLATGVSGVELADVDLDGVVDLVLLLGRDNAVRTILSPLVDTGGALTLPLLLCSLPQPSAPLAPTSVA